MSVQSILPQTPLLYCKTGVCRGIPSFLIFAPKHRLWVPTVYVLSKNKKNIEFFLQNILIFTTLKISVYCMGKFSQCEVKLY